MRVLQSLNYGTEVNVKCALLSLKTIANIAPRKKQINRNKNGTNKILATIINEQKQIPRTNKICF